MGERKRGNSGRAEEEGSGGKEEMREGMVLHSKILSRNTVSWQQRCGLSLSVLQQLVYVSNALCALAFRIIRANFSVKRP